MHVIQVFNSSGLNGPEMLVIPALAAATWSSEVWSLHESRLGSYSAFEKLCLDHNLRLRRIAVASRLDVSALWHMHQLLSQNIPRVVVHSHDAKASVYAWIAMAGLGRAKPASVVTHHGVVGRPDRLSRLYERILTYGSRFFADRILSVCSSDHDLLTQRGLPEAKLQLHQNGIDRPPCAWSERRAQGNEELTKLIIVGRLSAEKNHRRLISILAHFKKITSIPWQLDIVGAGALETALRDQCADAGVAERVRFLGYVTDAWRQFDAYDCLLNVSLGEGFPISLLEAGWRTTPVFAAAVGGVPELCGSQGAVYFSHGEADSVIARRLAEFLASESRRKQAAETLSGRVRENYSQRRWLDTAAAIYQNAIAECAVRNVPQAAEGE